MLTAFCAIIPRRRNSTASSPHCSTCARMRVPADGASSSARQRPAYAQVHERTLQGDFLMTLLRDIVASRRAAGNPLKVRRSVCKAAACDGSVFPIFAITQSAGPCAACDFSGWRAGQPLLSIPAPLKGFKGAQRGCATSESPAMHRLHAGWADIRLPMPVAQFGGTLWLPAPPLQHSWCMPRRGARPGRGKAHSWRRAASQVGGYPNPAPAGGAHVRHAGLRPVRALLWRLPGAGRGRAHFPGRAPLLGGARGPQALKRQTCIWQGFSPFPGHISLACW